jgi:hypothetical protein
MHVPPPLERLRGGNKSSASYQNQLLLGRTPDVPPPPTLAQVIRTIVGFVALLALAYLGGHRRVHAMERQFNIAHLMTTGLPFLLLGLVASLPQVGVLTPSVLREIAPVLPVGLGWIGFVIGSRFDARALERLPGSTGVSVFVMTGVPIAVILAGMAWAMSLIRQQPVTGEIVRDALLLGTAGAMAARGAPKFFASLVPGQRAPERLSRVIELEQLAGVFGIMMVSAFYRPQGSEVAWHLPGTAWLFITLGIGTTMGIVLYATLTRIHKDPQFTAVLLGSVAFTAGMASFLRLSPVSVCFIAGAIAVNIGGVWKHQVREVFERLERPVYFLFMIIAGALWHPSEWQGWTLMAAFVAARFFSKWFSCEILRRLVPDLRIAEQRVLTAAPMGALSVAIVVSAQDLYSGPTVPWIVTAAIGGSLITEIALQIAVRRVSRMPSPASPAHVAAAASEVD